MHTTPFGALINPVLACSPTLCPTCHRITHDGINRKINFDRRICRCGKAWNSRAVNRIRNWVCERKQPYTYDEAVQAADEIRMDGRGSPAPYKCPFGDHYHVGHKPQL
jgi:hypothetical protein